eukprot:6197285-Pleurochrysis_carterae.AAC.1
MLPSCSSQVVCFSFASCFCELIEPSLDSVSIFIICNCWPFPAPDEIKARLQKPARDDILRYERQKHLEFVILVVELMRSDDELSRYLTEAFQGPMVKRRKYLEPLSLKAIPQHRRRFNEARKHLLGHLEWIRQNHIAEAAAAAAAAAVAATAPQYHFSRMVFPAVPVFAVPARPLQTDVARPDP